MKNLDARTATLAQSAHVRAHSGREPAAGGARAPADAFEIVFRRMKDQTAPANPAPTDSQALRVPDRPRGHSPPAARAETSPLMRFPVRSGFPEPSEFQEPSKFQDSRHPFAAQDARAGGRAAPARNIAADMAIRMVDAPSDAALRPPAPSGIPLAREAALDSLFASTGQPVSGTVANISSAANPTTGIATTLKGHMQFAQIAPESVKLANPTTGIAATLEGRAQFAQVTPQGVEFTLAPAKTWDAAAPGDTAARFMPAMPHSAHEAVAEPYVGPPHFSTSASAFGTLGAEAGAFPGRTEGTAGIAGEPLADAANGGVISQLTLTPRAEPVVPQVTGIERVQLLDQVVQVVRVAQHNKSTEIIVHLKPEFLGRLSIRVLADDQGMRIEIRAENQIVREVLADNLADLQQRLSEKGLTFDQFNVFAELGSHSKREPDRGLDAPTADTKAAEQDSPEAVTVETAPLAPSSVIDYFA